MSNQGEAGQDTAMLELVGHLYEAASESSNWPKAWAAIVNGFRGISGSLFLDAPSGIRPLAFPGWSDVALRLYAEYFNRTDPWARAARGAMQSRSGPIRTFLGQEYVPAAHFEASETWRDFSSPHVGAFHIVGAGLDLGRGSIAMLGLHRSRDMAEFDAGDRARLELLLPHLRNSLHLAHRLAEAEAIGQAGFGALNALTIGAVIVDGQRHVAFANRAAEILAQDTQFRLKREGGGPGSGIASLHLSAATSKDQARITRLIEAAAGLGAGGATRLEPEADGRQISLLITPLPRSLSTRPQSQGGLSAIAAGFVLILVQDVTRPSPLPIEILEALYGLTATEAFVAVALLGGHTAEEVAIERGVSLPTIRTQIRSILEKTGARGLRELERFVAAP